MLTEVLELAKVNGNKLTKDEINIFFKDISLDQEQLELVYSYLEANKITVEGHEKSDKVKLFEEKKVEEVEELEVNKQDTSKDKGKEKKDTSLSDDKYLEMYLEELREHSTYDEKDKELLYQKMKDGDSIAKSQFIEIYLSKVVEIAKKYVNRGLALSDLIQEGNIGLMLTLDDSIDTKDYESFKMSIDKGIENAMEDALEEADAINLADKQLVSKVNYLNQGLKNLEEDMGRTVSMEELAKYLDMSKEEVEDIIRVSDDEIVVLENQEKKRD